MHLWYSFGIILAKRFKTMQLVELLKSLKYKWTCVSCGARFFSRTIFHLFLCFAFMQQQHRILNVSVGYPGSIHDSRVLFNSELTTNTEAFLRGPSVNVNGIEATQMLVADAGYSMQPWLITPFPG
jgi:hypothetical protein